MSADTPSQRGTREEVTAPRRVGRPLAATVGVVPSQAAVVAGGIAVATVLFVAGSLFGAGVVLGGLTSGALLAAAIATVAIDRPIRALVGGVGLLVAVGGTAGGLIAAGTLGGLHAGGLFTGGVLVGFGVARFRLAAFGNGAVSGALGWLARVVLIIVLTATFVALLSLDMGWVRDGAAGIGPLLPLVTPTSPGGAMIGFVAACWLAYGGIWLAIVAAPVSSLLAPAREARVTAALSRVLTVVGGVFGVGSILIAVAYAVVVSGGVLQSVEPALSALVESPLVRITLLRLAAAGVLVATAVTLVKAAGARTIGSRPTWVPSALVVTVAVVGGLLAAGHRVETVLVAADPTGWAITGVVSVLGSTAVGLFGVGAGLVALIGVMLCAPLAVTLGVLPVRSVGPRLVLFGSVLVAASAVAGGDGGVVRPLLGVAAGVVAWDIAEYGVGVTADVGLTPARRDTMIAHAGGSLLVGTAGVLVGGIVYAVLGGVGGVVSGSLLTAVTAVAAVVVLVVLLRR